MSTQGNADAARANRDDLPELKADRIRLQSRAGPRRDELRVRSIHSLNPR